MRNPSLQASGIYLNSNRARPRGRKPMPLASPVPFGAHYDVRSKIGRWLRLPLSILPPTPPSPPFLQLRGLDVASQMLLVPKVEYVYALTSSALLVPLHKYREGLDKILYNLYRFLGITTGESCSDSIVQASSAWYNWMRAIYLMRMAKQWKMSASGFRRKLGKRVLNFREHKSPPI